MGKALDGIRILDMTHVQSGPTCTQILAWFGADVIKIERPGEGDPTRGQLRDVPGVDSLYFTMLNGNKRAITLNPKTEAGNEDFHQAHRAMRRDGGELCSRRDRSYGVPWEKIQQINPRMIYASVKGFGPGPYEDFKVYENVAQCTGGAASTTGEINGVPLVTGAQIGDSGTGIHLVAGILAALFQRERPARPTRHLRDAGCRVESVPREAPRSTTPRARPAQGISAVSQWKFGSRRTARRQRFRWRPSRLDRSMQRLGNRSGLYIYVIAQAASVPDIRESHRPCGLAHDPDYNTPDARLPRLRLDI